MHYFTNFYPSLLFYQVYTLNLLSLNRNLSSTYITLHFPEISEVLEFEDISDSDESSSSLIEVVSGVCGAQLKLVSILVCNLNEALWGYEPHSL